MSISGNCSNTEGFVVLMDSGKISVVRDLQGFQEDKMDMLMDANEPDEVIINAKGNTRGTFVQDDDDADVHDPIDGSSNNNDQDHDSNGNEDNQVNERQENDNEDHDSDVEEIGASYEHAGQRSAETRSGRQTRRPRYYHEEFSYLTYFASCNDDTPSTYHEAVNDQFP
jgi:hypothetical protein